MAQTVLTNLMPKMGLSKKALLLGAGFVTKPTLQMLSDAGVDVTVACRTLANAQKLCSGINNTHPTTLKISDTPERDDELDDALSKVDVVISLIPYTYHANVIRSAIRTKKNVVTTSYVSPAMLELDREAKEAGITVVNEIGLDPGIDHLYAVKTIDEVHNEGGKINGFLSYCGGLPAPESSGNPLGYKFSWSSRGVLLALRNTAKFFKEGKEVEIPGKDLMASARPYHITPGFNFVAYANRDSTPYRERYSIPEAQTVIRGTLRYGGFPEFVRTLTDIGFLSDASIPVLSADNPDPPTWSAATAATIGSRSDDEAGLLSKIAGATKFGSKDEESHVVSGLRWLGILSSKKITPRGNPLDTLCATLEEKMQYEEGDRDFVMLQHKFDIEWKDGTKEVRTSTLCEYGDKVSKEGYTSAMARLVGVPCAVAVKLVLEGKIEDKGILAPVNPKLAGQLREEIEKYGITMKEKTLSQ